ncbi:50S ribosomal protein L13 [Candidatus Endowatersipora endosymbiont of Watersipora subatra]|uniref:50S ribosomal protein L13 n=1 Tax=Candidatus Endowatersipora endosymbiont of Watersipora subatra TaxID=3077946 RepID=UPI00312C7819
MKTFSQKAAEVQKKWILVDAKDLVPGRLAPFVANRLRGKHKPTYTPHIDDGDNVILVNVDKVWFTGKKLNNKKYQWHTGYPGGLKVRTAFDFLNSRFPERIIRKAIERMMPRGPLARRQMKHLYLYSGSEHKHEAQKPEMIDFSAINSKNKRSYQ